MKLCRFFMSLSMLWLVGLLLISCTPGPALNLTTDSNSVQAGQSFTVTLQAENVTGLTAFEAHLAFDPAFLEVVSIQNGSFLQADFVVQNTFDNAAGTIDYAAAQLNHPAAEGSGTLLLIEFRAKSAGTSSVRFRVTPAAAQGALLANVDGNAIQVNLGEANVSVVP